MPMQQFIKLGLPALAEGLHFKQLLAHFSGSGAQLTQL
jgi:hypothetical protein